MKNIYKLFIFLLLLPIVLGAQVVSAKDNLPDYMARIYQFDGANRVETAVMVSEHAYHMRERPGIVFLAGYDGEADALTATFMAGEMKAPLLIADKNKLSQVLLNELQVHNPKEIVLLGGEQSISNMIEEELRSKNYQTRRIQGDSRVETAVALARDYYADKQLEEIFLVEYNSLVDALAIGPVSAKTGIPVLITTKDRVPEEVSDFIRDKGIEKVTIIGGAKYSQPKRRGRLKSIC